MSSPVTDRISAGAFGEWLSQFRASLRGDGGAEVPCGDCVGCCVSAYHVPIRPQDALARASIPKAFLVAAPGQPPNHTMMKYLADGTCPMLSDGECSIYDRRPQTCRDYDCRVFAAAGIDAGGPDKAAINRRIRAWRFSYSSEADRSTHRAVLEAAAFIRGKRASFPGGHAPSAPTGIAVLALKTYSVFMDSTVTSFSDEEIALRIVEASREFAS